MISRFFIDRPIFATVLSVVITLVGLIVCFFGLGGLIYAATVKQLVRWLGQPRLALIGGVILGLAYVTLALAPVWWLTPLAVTLVGLGFYMLHNTLQTHGTQMAPEARGSAVALFSLCLFGGQAIGVPLAAPIVDRYGAVPIFVFAAVFLPLLAWYFAWALQRRRLPVSG